MDKTHEQKKEKDQSKIDELRRLIRHLTIEIDAWPSRNSQSNPGAVMELRSMKKDRERAEQALIALL